eukprot:2831954-Prorocentrum_lima.AAC.1
MQGRVFPPLKVGSKIGQAMRFAGLDAFRGADLRPWAEFTPDVYIDTTEDYFFEVEDVWHFPFKEEHRR